MTRFRMAFLSSDALPKIALTGLALAIVAFVVGALALFRVSVVANQKADRADARSQAAARQTLLAVCALANAQRSGNMDAPPPSTSRGAYVAVAWQVTFDSLGCTRFTREELESAVPTPTALPSMPVPSPR